MTDQVNLPPRGSLTLASILEEAIKREEEYDWPGATEHYLMALQNLPGSEVRNLAVISEKLGYAVYRWARQAENVDEFASRISESIAHYEKAKGVCERLDGPAETGRQFRCLSMILFLRGWLEPNPAEKRKLFHESWRIGKEALRVFKEASLALEYGKLYNELSQVCLVWNSDLDCLFEPQMKIVRDACEYGEDAISLLSKIGEPNELAKACSITVNWMSYLSGLLELDEREGYYQKVQEYWKRAVELSEEVAYVELIVSSSFVSSSLAYGTDEMIRVLEKSLEYSRKTRDRYYTGTKLEQLFIQTTVSARTVEDPDERTQLFSKALQYAQDASEQFSRISMTGLFLPVHSPNAQIYWELSFWETDLAKKREFLAKAAESGPDLLKKTEDTGMLFMIAHGYDIFSKILVSLAKFEPNPDKKKSRLEQALQHRIKANQLDDQVFGQADPWRQGINQNWLAEIKSELCDLSRDPETKETLLKEALREKESALKNCAKETERFERTGEVSQFVRIALIQYELGVLLTRLYNFTRNPDEIGRAAESFEQSAEYYKKPNLAIRMAECYWKAAEMYDVLSEHVKAAEAFNFASGKYNAAAEKLPQLKGFYRDYASYMEAWSEIEKAKHHHERQDYASARDFYEKAASLHKSTNEWSFLTPNYSALAQVENGEDLSRKEMVQEAIQAFHQASRLFNETKTMLQAERSKIENVEKKQMVASLVKGADLRRDYCNGRIALEEAKVLDRKGDYSSSSQKYGHAAETFEKLAQTTELEQGRMEVKLVAAVSRAWQIMIKAEAETAPELYMKASALFEEVKELSPTEKGKSLALGHSRLCRALDAGTRFADTGDPSLHAIAIQHLESASKYYLKGGFQDASECAEATELLFDAYLNMNEAKREKDHEKKTKLYAMIEKVLQAAAEFYLKAQYPAKRQEVLRLIEKVKREKELTMSLTDVLHAPVFVSATTAFSAPTPAREKAVGLDRFEHADVQASLIARHKSVNVGEDLDMEIELVNAGKGPAQLIKVEELIPQGFELTVKSEHYRVEDSYLNMKGRRLDPLKTEEVKLVLKPKAQGQFTLKPRILYLDESGKYKSSEPEPLEVTVRELGISGWLKGR